MLDNTAVTQEIFKWIDALAAKLGTTVEYLWPKLVKWQFYEAIGSIVAMALATAASAWALKWFLKKAMSYEKKNYCDDGNLLYGFLTIASGVLLTGLAISWSIMLPTWIATLVSPEATTFLKFIGK